MPEMKLGSVHTKNVYLGGVQAKSVYYGPTRVWPRMVPWTDTFDRQETSTLGSDWRVPVSGARSCSIQLNRAANPDIGDNVGRWGAHSGILNASAIPEWENYKVTAQLIAPYVSLADDNWTTIILGWDGVVGSTNQIIGLSISTASGCYIITNTFSDIGTRAGDAFGGTILKEVSTHISTTASLVFEKNGTTFTGYVNGTNFISTTWAGLSGSDQASRRRPTICIEGNNPVLKPQYSSPCIDSITIEDI